MVSAHMTVMNSRLTTRVPTDLIPLPRSQREGNLHDNGVYEGDNLAWQAVAVFSIPS